MAIPGQNLLNMAFRIIATQTIVYYQALGRLVNSVGQDVTEYNAGVNIRGSFQPVPKNLYELYGLDLQKTYYTFYAPYAISDIARDVSGDQIAFNGQRFQCESNNDWFAIDGWKGVLCIHIGLDVADDFIWGFNQIPQINTYKNFGNGNFIGTTGLP